MGLKSDGVGEPTLRCLVLEGVGLMIEISALEEEEGEKGEN